MGGCGNMFYVSASPVSCKLFHEKFQDLLVKVEVSQNIFYESQAHFAENEIQWNPFERTCLGPIILSFICKGVEKKASNM